MLSQDFDFNPYELVYYGRHKTNLFVGCWEKNLSFIWIVFSFYRITFLFGEHLDNWRKSI